MRTPTLLKSLALLTLALIYLAGCQPAVTTGTPVVMGAPAPTPFPQTSVTPTNTPTVTPSASPRPTQRQPILSQTPSFENSQVVEDFFFAGAEGPGCELPCWHGLRIGESGLEDIQRLFDEVFGFNGVVDFVEENPFAGVDLRYYALPEVPGYYVTGWIWGWPEPPEGRGGGLKIILWLDNDTNRMAGMRVFWMPAGGVFHVHSLQKIIRKLGQPAFVFVSQPKSLTPPIESTSLLIIYENGIAFSFESLLMSVKPETGSGEARYFGELCLESAVIQGAGNDYITEPMADGLEDLSPLQHALFGFEISAYNLVPIDLVFDTDLQTLTHLAMTQQDACIRTKP